MKPSLRSIFALAANIPLACSSWSRKQKREEKTLANSPLKFGTKITSHSNVWHEKISHFRRLTRHYRRERRRGGSHRGWFRRASFWKREGTIWANIDLMMRRRAFFLIENIFRVKFPPDDDRNYVHKNWPFILSATRATRFARRYCWTQGAFVKFYAPWCAVSSLSLLARVRLILDLD